MEYWMATTGIKKEQGINGELSKSGNEGMPNMNTIGVPSVDKFTNKIQDKGGKILMPKMPIPGLAVCNLSGDRRKYLWNNRAKQKGKVTLPVHLLF